MRKHYASTLLTAEEVTTLNEARTILSRCCEALSRPSNVPTQADAADIISAGRVAESAEAAKDSVFNFLNSARSYVDVPISEDILLNLQGE